MRERRRARRYNLILPVTILGSTPQRGEEERKALVQENFYETNDMDQNRAHGGLGLL
jgi:hypothetical protein